MLTFFVTEAVPRILVDCGFSFTLGRVDQQRQWVVRPFARVGRVGSHRNGRISLYVEGGLAQGRVRQDMDRPFEPLAAVVVEPGALWQVDVTVLDTGTGYGGDEQGVAEQELVVGRVCRLVGGVLEQKGTQDRRACPVALVEERVKVGEESLAKFDHLPAHRLVGLAEGPRLLAAGPYRGVVAAVRLEDPELRPAGQKLSVRVAPESSHVDPGPGDAGEGEVLELWHAHPQVLPPAGVVTGPVHGVALQASVASAGDYERPFVGPQGQKAPSGGTGHQGTVGVVDLGVPPGLTGPPARMDHIVWHRGPVGYEERRLVHVAPDPGNPGIGKNPLVLSPPLARLGVGEVGEGAHAWPNDVVVLLALARLAVKIPLPSLGVYGVVLVHLHAGIDDGDHPEALLPQVGDQAPRVGEAVLVPGEDPVALHVVDVQVDNIARDVPLPETTRDLAHLFLVHVGVAALLIPQSPQRRHRGAARELGVAVDYLPWGRPTEDVVHDGPTLSPVVGAVLIFQREVELYPVGVVEEEAVGLAVRDREGERDSAVEVVEGGGVPQRRIHVVEDLVGARLLQPASPLAAPKVPFSCLSPFVEPYRTTQGLREDVSPRGLDGAHPELFVVRSERPAGMVGEPDTQRVQRDAGNRRSSGERELLVGLLHGDLDSTPVLLGNALRVVSRQSPGREHPDPEQVGGQGCHFDGRGPCPHPQSSVVMVEQLRGAERFVVAPCLGLLLEGFGQCSSLRSSQHFSTPPASPDGLSARSGFAFACLYCSAEDHDGDAEGYY